MKRINVFMSKQNICIHTVSAYTFFAKNAVLSSCNAIILKIIFVLVSNTIL